MLTEEKIIRLVEERGVWPAPYKQDIKKLVNRIVKQFKTLGKSCTIKINPIDLKFVKEVEEFNMSVKFNLVNNSYNSWGGGENEFIPSMILNNNKQLPKANVLIMAAFNKDGYVFERTLYNNMTHEIHHILDVREELLNELTKNNEYNKVSTTRLWNNENKTKKCFNELSTFFTNEKLSYIKKMIYRLFNYHELNALVSGVYGDLSGMYSKRDNFNSDLKNTQAYKIYAYFKDTYRTFVNSLNESEINKLYTILRKYEYIISSYNNTVSGYKQAIYRAIDEKLRNIFNGIGRAASLYYDTTEEEIELHERLKTDKIPMKLINSEEV